MENKHYDCKTCINRGSPLCELCIQIHKPSGKETKPTYYIAQSEAQSYGGLNKPTRDPQIEERANYLIHLLCQRVPIPTCVVLEYNQLTEPEIK